MKMLYVFISYSEKGSAVQTKVLNQISYLNKAGVQCRGAFFTWAVTGRKSLNEHVDLIPYPRSGKKYFNHLGNRLNLEVAIEDHLRDTYTQYDAFYFRYPLASKGLYRIVKRFGDKIIFEHQAKEIPEIISLVRTERFRLKLGYLLFVGEAGLLKAWKERYYGGRILRKLKGGIAVTSEVARYENGRVRSYNCHVVGNGIELERFPIVRDVSFNGKDLNIFMLIGANTSSPTHGMDRLISSVKHNTSRFNIRLSIFSKNIYPSEKGNNYEIRYEGFLSQQELTSKLEGMHFAIGGLASFRKNVLFGSALKVREYYARGFPIIMANIDEDIAGDTEAGSFVIQVPNEEADLDFRAIADRIETILAVPDRPDRIRSIAARLFSLPAKMQELRDKTEMIINSRK